MRTFSARFACIFFWLAIAASALCPGLGHCQTIGDIFIWTKHQMNIQNPVAAPSIQWVGRAELKQVFVQHNHNAYMQWEDEFGSDKAEKLLRIYLDEIVGIFITHTKIVYIGNFLEQCRQQAVLAHELVHYLQQTTRGQVTGDDEGADHLRWMREREAYTIEANFRQAFCEPDSREIRTRQNPPDVSSAEFTW